MATFSDCSLICSVRGQEAGFRKIVAMLDGAKLPIRTQWANGSMSFYYDGKCGGDTLHYLGVVIQGLIGFSKSK